MIYDRTLMRPCGRTDAMVAWLKLHPGAVCLVPNEARKKLLIDRHGAEPASIVVVGTPAVERVENANVWEYQIDDDGFDQRGRATD